MIYAVYTEIHTYNILAYKCLYNYKYVELFLVFHRPKVCRLQVLIAIDYNILMILGLFRVIQLQGCSPEGATLFLNKVHLLRRIYLGAVTLSTTLSQAQSTSIRIFLNAQLFFTDSKISLS